MKGRVVRLIREAGPASAAAIPDDFNLRQNSLRRRVFAVPEEAAIVLHIRPLGVAVRACFSFALSLRWALGLRYLPTTRLNTMAAMPASTALPIGDDRMLVIDPNACC